MRIAIVGAGGSATHYIQSQLAEHVIYEVFTTDGEGQLGGKSAQLLSELDHEGFDKIVICSQFIDEILKSLGKLGVAQSKIHYFDFKQKLEVALENSQWTLTMNKPKILLALYDLKDHNLTFNFAIFASGAQTYAAHHGFDGISFVVLSGGFNHVSFRDKHKYSCQQFEWRISNILPATAQLASLTQDFSVMRPSAHLDALLASYDPEHIYPQQCVRDGVLSRESEASIIRTGVKFWQTYGTFQGLAATQQSLEYVDAFLQTFSDCPVITLSIRGTSYQTEKNSSLQDWISLSEFLQSRGYTVVIVPDILHSFDENVKALFPGAHFFSNASFNLLLRTALYERAFFNISCASGPATNLFFNKNARFMVFCNEIIVMGIDGFERNVGLRHGEMFPFLQDYQWMFWQTDHYDNMREQFLAVEHHLVD